MAAGGFTNLGGQPRNKIGLLSSNTAALQNLSVDSGGSSIAWMRSGAFPEVCRVAFEQSTEGLTYTSLGVGTRINGGWQLTSLSLVHNQNSWIRARGYYATGAYNGSASVVESVRNVYLPWKTIYLPLIKKN